jgi:hypothetical protein
MYLTAFFIALNFIDRPLHFLSVSRLVQGGRNEDDGKHFNLADFLRSKGLQHASVT